MRWMSIEGRDIERLVGGGGAKRLLCTICVISFSLSS